MLIATPNGERRLFRQGDEAHPARAGKITPEREDLPEAYRSLLDWYLTTYDTPSSNVEDNVTSLPDMEAAVQAQTERELFEAQTLLMRVLNTYIDGFSELGSYTAAHDRDPRILMLALITRSFNSSWCAYDLARRRHYQQSIALSRMVQEDWLTSFDVAFNEDTRSALWGKRRPRSFQAMAEAVSKVLPEDDKGQWWRDSYGPASEASHPRGLALAMQFERDAIRFGPIYARSCVRLSGHADRCCSQNVNGVQSCLFSWFG